MLSRQNDCAPIAWVSRSIVVELQHPAIHPPKRTLDLGRWFHLNGQKAYRLQVAPERLLRALDLAAVRNRGPPDTYDTRDSHIRALSAARKPPPVTLNIDDFLLTVDNPLRPIGSRSPFRFRNCGFIGNPIARAPREIKGRLVSRAASFSHRGLGECIASRSQGITQARWNVIGAFRLYCNRAGVSFIVILLSVGIRWARKAKHDCRFGSRTLQPLAYGWSNLESGRKNSNSR